MFTEHLPNTKCFIRILFIYIYIFFFFFLLHFKPVITTTRDPQYSQLSQVAEEDTEAWEQSNDLSKVMHLMVSRAGVQSLVS